MAGTPVNRSEIQVDPFSEKDGKLLGKPEKIVGQAKPPEVESRDHAIVFPATS